MRQLHIGKSIASSRGTKHGTTELKSPKAGDHSSSKHLPIDLQRVPTMRDVADRCGVSVGTVSRVLNGNATVAEDIRRRVEAAIAALGYVPNRIAQSMRRRATNAVGCLVTDIRLTIAGSLVSGAENLLREAGYDLILASTHNDPVKEAHIWRFFRERQLDAIITVSTDDQSDERTRLLQSLRMPVVLWERDGGENFDSVLTDHFNGCLEACSYLLSLGHQRIALVGGRSSVWAGREMERGYRAAMDRAGREVDPNLLFSADSFNLTACSELLREGNGVTAVIGVLDVIVLLCTVARSAGRSIPRDLSVISIGDSDTLNMNSPAISAIRYDAERFGRTAAEFVLDRLGDEPPTKIKRLIMPIELIVRQSCAPPRPAS